MNPPILVCGTGIAGLACALGLSRAGLPVALLGPRHPPALRPADDYHPRVYAISSASQALLDRLGAWRLMDMRRVTPVETMEIHGDAQGTLDLSAWQDARDTLAWIVESGEIERALQQAVQVMGLAWHEDHFLSLNTSPDGVQVTTQQGRQWHTPLLVGADGARSPVRQAAGIQHDYTPYGDMGVVAHLDIGRAHQNYACQWFTGDSVFALLPMPDTANGPQASLVWSMPESQARQWMAMDTDAAQTWFASHAQAITGGRLGALRLRTHPQGFPLTLERSAMTAPGVALVGDAAHRVHPLAGQGLNLGLGDVDTLLQVLSTREAHRPLGDPRLLARYRRRRAEPVIAMGLVTHGLHRLFATPCVPLAWARNQGMLVANQIPFLKRQLIRAAAGN
ncbi:FAD-dependent monooxygenase [Castellaniella sp.]|uniref:FAD-dependent monooxygenase n=1 Tax=Castellaniella sp. TaxID=1955812 RepID=UPI002AFE55CB|nr:FAD-dependent monooxygenase [Castellaniella sp.]